MEMSITHHNPGLYAGYTPFDGSSSSSSSFSSNGFVLNCGKIYWFVIGSVGNVISSAAYNNHLRYSPQLRERREQKKNIWRGKKKEIQMTTAYKLAYTMFNWKDAVKAYILPSNKQLPIPALCKYLHIKSFATF